MKHSPDVPVPFFPAPDGTGRASQLSAFIRHLERETGTRWPDYVGFEKAMVEDYRSFWQGFLDWAGILADGEPHPVCTSDAIEHADFFPNLSLSYPENLLAGDDDLPAIVSCRADRPALCLTRSQLRDRVARAAAGFAALGVAPGDRVAAIAHNDVDAVVACLATAALGASFSTAAPEMGAAAILSRFGQLEPVVLVAHADQRAGNGPRDDLAEIVAGLPSLRCVVTLGDFASSVGFSVPTHALAELGVDAGASLPWQRYPFNHPLFVLFSSGTTGAPKCIVHGAGGTLLEHLKELRLHCDLRPGDRLFFQTSCAWMMWNWQLSALACRATIVLYDGALNGPETLWDIVAEHDVDVFGTSPAYLKLCEATGYHPNERYALPRLRAVLSTGSILFDGQFDWVRRRVKPLPVQSISGGTDIIGCFVLGNPDLPVWRGEAQCRSLGLDVIALGANAEVASPGEIGELVCRNPFPSRPLGFIGDADGSRFHRAYFSVNPGVWTHGDRVSFAGRGTARLHGRSDGTLNVRGIRIGTADIYAALEDVPELVDVMAVEQDLPDSIAGSRIVLLVVLSRGTALTADLILRLRRQIAKRVSAAHVPGSFLDVTELPTTHSGKRSEIAAREAINGRPVPNRAALRNPECLDVIAAHPRLAAGSSPTVDRDCSASTIDVLRTIWANALGVESVGENDDLFALGADSLLAMTVCMRVEEELGFELPLSSLFHASTPASLAHLFEDGSAALGGAPLVLLRTGTGRPIFLIHSVVGHVLEWRFLVAHLETGRPVEALQARGLNPGEGFSSSVTEMARDYVSLIRARQACGPYTLLGYSFGGMVAHEIAIQLAELGESVDLLGLIDTDVSAKLLPVRDWFKFRLRRIAQVWQDIASERNLKPLQRILYFHRLIREDAPLSATSEATLAFHRVRRACERALRAYNPPTYAGKLTFFRAAELDPRRCDPLVIWRQRAASIEVVSVSGSHSTMIREPHVRSVAGEITSRL